MERRVRLAVLLGLVAAVAAQDAAPTDGGGEGDKADEGGAKEGGGEVGASTRPPLTGNPQIDYLVDPNLPHELIGYDLSEYPFYNKLPKDLLDPKFNFTCDGRHDGFYASIPHKCQVYHNCLFGQRYDFLCANYTVFDQKNFICHYVSEVDCPGSEKHYDRNDELYVTTTTTTTTTTPKPRRRLNRPRPGNRPRQGEQGGRQGEGEGSDTGEGRPRGGSGGRPGGRGRPRQRNNPTDAEEPIEDTNPRQQGGGGQDQDSQDAQPDTSTGGSRRRPSNRPRPKINLGRKPTTTTTTTTEAAPEYYYDDYYDYSDNADTTTTTTTTTAAPAPGRRVRPSSRTRSRGGSEAAETEPTTDAPSTQRGRVSVRRTPLVDDQGPTEDEGADTETASSPRQQPKFPSRRGSVTRNEPETAPEEEPVIEEEVVAETAVEEQPTGPSRRRTSSRRGSGRPGPSPPKEAEPEYYYDDY
uniref:Peritrophin 2 n=1 Tax=Eriocheir sinensis TaxID=95602 RepID=A0A1Z1BLK1_ERISI|nr:peritrophin 2 [Eriocheir sinensis]